MAWAYIFAMAAWTLIPSVRKSGKLIIPLILLLGIIPDSDLLLDTFGIMHRTVTHSFLLWTLIFIPLFIMFRLKSLPYFVAVVQHFAFGDILMGKVMIFWPFNRSYIGFGFAMPSTFDVAMETAGLLIAAAIIIYSGDLRRTLAVEKRNTLMALPLMAIIISGLFFAIHWQSINVLIAYILSSKIIIILAVGHLILITYLALSTIQGLRAYRPTQQENKTKISPRTSRQTPPKKKTTDT